MVNKVNRNIEFLVDDFGNLVLARMRPVIGALICIGAAFLATILVMELAARVGV